MQRFDPVNELTTARYTASLVDETGAVVPASSLSALTLLLYDKATGTVLNGRNNQNVLNTNGVTVDENGNLVWILSPPDNTIVTTTEPHEVHVAVFTGHWGAGKEVTHDIAITVRNLRLS